MIRLYLDLDGVLHPFSLFHGQAGSESAGHYRTCGDGRRVFWHPGFFEHVEALAEALEPFPEVHIFVHSSWRFMWREARSEDLAAWLGPLGTRYIRFVPRHIQAGTRLEVIRMDMAADKYIGPWVAVDDFVGEFNGVNPDNFVGTRSEIGLADRSKLDELVTKLKVGLRT